MKNYMVPPKPRIDVNKIVVRFNRAVGEYELWYDSCFMFASQDGLAVLEYKKKMLTPRLQVGR